MLLGSRLDLLTSIERPAKRRGSRATSGRVQPNCLAITRDSNDVYTISSSTRWTRRCATSGAVYSEWWAQREIALHGSGQHHYWV